MEPWAVTDPGPEPTRLVFTPRDLRAERTGFSDKPSSLIIWMISAAGIGPPANAPSSSVSFLHLAGTPNASWLQP